MKRCFSLRLGGLLAAIALSGCATVITTHNHDEDSLVYAGTRMDAELLASPFKSESGNWISLPGLGFIVWPLALIDLPFSMVADTVLLPYTITVDHQK